MKKDNLVAVLKYTKGFRLPMVLSFALLAVELVFAFISPLIMSVTIDSVLGGKPLNTPWYFSWFVHSVGGIDTIKANLWIMAAAMVGLQIIMGIVRFIRARSNNLAGEGAVKTLRDRLYAHIQRLPFSFHANAQTGDIIQRATNDVDTVRRFITNMMLEFIRTILLLIVGLFVMLTLNIPLALITFFMVFPVAITSVWFFNRISRYNNEQEIVEGKLFTVIQENLTGTRVVRAFGRQAHELSKFDEQNEENRKRLLKVNYTFANLWATLDLMCGLEIALIMIVGIILTVDGKLTVGQYTAFSSYVFLFFWPIRGFGRVLNQFSRTMVAVGRIEEIFHEKEEEDLDSGLTPDMSGDICFTDVDFAYDTVPVIKKMNMTIKGGSTVAFLGGTGSGKSSLSLLLQRLYEPQAGTISIGGTDIRDIKKTYLRNRISIVLQEPFLYSKTLLDNIGIKQKSPSLSDVQEAARSASIDEDILSFEDGYDTVVGERGVTLSGGQKQRVAIARALMGESDVLIFDDSLSAVDTKTDAAIRDALTSRRKNVTTIIISHRITTLMEADKIFVIQDGHVVEEGSHNELMEIGGIYKRTYDIQNAVVEEGSEVL
ncbi:MAG: ABC transporter ATP-binding protein [Clostridiales bacterium]|nr:ABC transporter ATP-binding protein [Clostridiales bacterium]